MRLRIGKTQGMMLSSKPPTIAPSKAASNALSSIEEAPCAARCGMPAAGTVPGVAVSETPVPSPSFKTPSTASSALPLAGPSVSMISVSPAREKVWTAA